MAFAIDSPGHLLNRFTDGDPVTGLDPTIVSDEWLNMVQDELLRLIIGAGLTPSKADNGQLLAAVRAMILQQAGLIGDLRDTDVGNLNAAIAALGGRVGTLEGKTAGRLLRVAAYGDPGVWTHTFFEGCDRVIFEIVGGGASGGGGPSPPAGYALVGAGGGAGGYTSGIVYGRAANIGPTIDLTVAAGGKGRMGDYGLAGGTSSFGRWGYALGGAPGKNFGFSNANGTGGSGAGAPPGSAGGFDAAGIRRVCDGIRVAAGSPGHTGLILAPTTALGGAGGSGPWGGGGAQIGANSPGSRGIGPGSAGGGCCLLAGQGPAAGGDGADGHILVWEYGS